MGKSSSSSSRKKNRSIASPPVHSKKISKSRRKKAKLKKLSRRQRHDSDHSSDDNSSSLLSASSSSYEDDEKSRRKKTKSKKLRTGRGHRRHHNSHYSSDDVASPSLLSSFSSSENDDDSRRKSSKTKNTTHSYSSESSEDSLPKKRRKGFGKNVKSNVRKKYQKKRSKRHISLDTSSAGSSSCSTCKDGSSGSEESEFERSRMRSGRKDKKRRYLEDKKHGTRRRDSSRGYSCSQCEDISRGDENEERSISLYNSMRLRSVIVVRNYDEEERNMENDQHQSGDSCRANDGNGDGSIEKLDYPHVEVEVNGHVRSEEGEGVASTNRNTRDFRYGDGENQFDRSHPLSDKAASGDNITDDSNKTCNRSDINDLETMLRQRALENLKRFRGGAHSTAGMSVSSKEMNGSDKKSALDPSESSQSSTVTAGQLDGSKIADLRRNSSDTKLNIAASSGTKHLISNQSVVKGLHQVASVNNVQTKVNSTNTFNGTKPWITSYTWRRDQSSGHPISLGSQASQASSVKKVTAETIVDEKAYKTSKTEASVDKDSRRAKVHSTVGGLPSCTGSINKVKDGGKDEAKYDKKAASIVQDAELPVLDEKALRSPQIRACGVQTSNKDELASGAQNIDSCPHPVSVKAEADKVKHIDSKSEQMGDSVMRGNKMTKGSVDANSAVISKTAPECPTLTNSVSLDMKSDTVKKQDKDEPKYEQKTLSVMRGGEMVQVNYQVYIPKRTPALARRQLKR